jgi:hypothetical protein
MQALPPPPAVSQPLGPAFRFHFATPGSVRIVITQAGRSETYRWTDAREFCFEVHGAVPPLFRTPGRLTLGWTLRRKDHSEAALFQQPLSFAIEVREGEMSERWTGAAPVGVPVPARRR